MWIALEVIEGPHRGRRFKFTAHESFLVGRASCAHFRLPRNDPYFSRIHFMVEVNPPRCRLVDLGSTNGTAVNGERVQAADLKHGDLIRGGNPVLKVSFSDPEAVGLAALAEEPLGAAESSEPSKPSVGSTVTQEPALAIEGYRIVRPLGRGGMGVVYLATRTADGTEVALKTIRPAVAGSARDVQRFLREASILRGLAHPNIVGFHEMDQSGEILYFAMDYVPGTDASRAVRRDGPMAIGRAVRLICQALEALDYAHNQGFVHRDVKPANLLLTGQPGHEICKLADFGLARVYQASPLSGLTLLGEVAGSVHYMPPEQILDYRNATPAVDIYATAAALYYLLTGHYVFDSGDLPTQRQLGVILSETPVPIRKRCAAIPSRLANAIHRALDKLPGARFADAQAFRDALFSFGGDK